MLRLHKLHLKVLFIFLLITSACKQIPSEQNKGVSTSLQEVFDWRADRVPLISAHRGGPVRGFPENCIETFENTLKLGARPTIIECDVALTKDNQLVMMHDETLDRTTSGKGKVKDKLLVQLQKLKLKDNQGNMTTYRVPTLDQVLGWAKGKVILTLDIKRGVDPEKVVEKIKKYQAENYAMVITYNLESALKYHNLNPDLMLSVSIKDQQALEGFRQSGIPFSQIVVFMGVGKYDAEILEALHKEGVYCILGTMWRQDKEARQSGYAIYTDVVSQGIDILATDEPQLALEGIKAYLKVREK